VSAFLKWSDKEQLQGGVQTKRAALRQGIRRDRCHGGDLLLSTEEGAPRVEAGTAEGKVLEVAWAARHVLSYSIMWSTGPRALGTLRLLMQGIEWFVVPDGERKEGWYLHIGGSKTETWAKQARIFQLWEDGSLCTSWALCRHMVCT
jgi:hypothetical protein